MSPAVGLISECGSTAWQVLYQNVDFPERGSRKEVGPFFVNPMLSIIGYAENMSSCGCQRV